jgi:hypothetical protein
VALAYESRPRQMFRVFSVLENLAVTIFEVNDLCGSPYSIV